MKILSNLFVVSVFVLGTAVLLKQGCLLGGNRLRQLIHIHWIPLAYFIDFIDCLQIDIKVLNVNIVLGENIFDYITGGNFV